MPGDRIAGVSIRRISRGATTAELSLLVTKRPSGKAGSRAGVPGYARLAYVGAQQHNDVIADAVRSRLLVSRRLVLVCGW
jgi:hypothetical protein